MRRALLITCLLACAAPLARASAQAGAAVQAGDSITVRATRRDTITATSTATAAFMVANASADSSTFTPRVDLPAGWTVLVGGGPLALAARSTEMLMLSAVVPARVTAGVYTIRVAVGAAVDSVAVLVPERRALEVTLVDRPAFTVSGKTYDAGFLLRNRGNLRAQVEVGGRSSMGIVALSEGAIELEPNEARVVRARVRTRAGLQAAADDVLELDVRQNGDTTTGHASARVTVIPEPDRKIEEFLKVPTRVNLRAASSDGVSPFEVFGQGIVRDGSDTRVDFLFRGPTGQFSAFGERDEYRLDLTAPSWRARLGDQFFMITPLTGSAQPGIGAGAETSVRDGALAFGGHGQQFRRSPLKGSEVAAFVAARPFDGGRVSVNFVDRQGGGAPARVGSAAAAYSLGAYRAEGELARSSAEGRSNGQALFARFTGAGSRFAFDAGHHDADTAFAGAQRGSTHDYVTASARPFRLVSFAANGGSHRTDLSPSIGIPYTERLDVGVLAATVADRLTIEVNGAQRSTSVRNVAVRGRQRALRARGDQATPFGQLSMEGQFGRAHDANGQSRMFSQLSLGVRRELRGGTVGVWGEEYSGGAVLQGTEGTRTFGGDASMRVGRSTNFTLTGYATRRALSAKDWHSQLDGVVTHALGNGRTISLRARLIGGGAYRAADQSVAYLEYGVPFRLPVSRLRTTGRVYGRVVDATTGAGVPGALVRLGPQVAITDARGEVAFGGVPGGEHRLSMSQETSFADAVFVGDPTLRVDSTRTRPTTFRVAIARSARIDVDVRRFAMRSALAGTLAGTADSLTDAGALADALLMLVGERDTLYRTTNESGKVSFTDVPPGAWVLSIRGEAPAFHRFDPDRVELELAPGEARELAFRLVPRRREVQMIGPGQELRPTTADPKASPPASGTRTIKPQQRQEKQS